MSASVRRAVAHDAGALAALHAQCFDEAWDETSFRRLLAGHGAIALLASADASATELQAFILLQVAAGQSEILSFGTLQVARRNGLARLLLAKAAAEAVQQGALEMFLEVAEDNAAALALYEAVGFVRSGRRRDYYRRGGGKAADALILRAVLPL